MLNHSHPSLPEMRLTPVPQDLTKRTTVVEEFSPQPKVIMMIHSDSHEYGLDVSELSDDDIDEISKLIGFAMKMESYDDLRLFIAEHKSLQLIEEAIHILYGQIGKPDWRAPEEFQLPIPTTLESTKMTTFLQTHFPSITSHPGFSIEPYLMENFYAVHSSTPASIDTSLCLLLDNKFRAITGKSFEELVEDHTISEADGCVLVTQRENVVRHFIEQLEELQLEKASVTQETTKPVLQSLFPSTEVPMGFSIIAEVVAGAIKNKELGFEASVEKAVGEIITKVTLTGSQEESSELTRQVLFAKSILRSDTYKVHFPELQEKKVNRSWYQRQNKIVKTVFAGACVGVVALALYRKFGNKAD